MNWVLLGIWWLWEDSWLISLPPSFGISWIWKQWHHKSNQAGNKRWNNLLIVSDSMVQFDPSLQECLSVGKLVVMIIQSRSDLRKINLAICFRSMVVGQAPLNFFIVCEIKTCIHGIWWWMVMHWMDWGSMVWICMVRWGSCVWTQTREFFLKSRVCAFHETAQLLSLSGLAIYLFLCGVTRAFFKNLTKQSLHIHWLPIQCKKYLWECLIDADLHVAEASSIWEFYRGFKPTILFAAETNAEQRKKMQDHQSSWVYYLNSFQPLFLIQVQLLQIARLLWCYLRHSRRRSNQRISWFQVCVILAKRWNRFIWKGLSMTLRKGYCWRRAHSNLNQRITGCAGGNFSA